MTKRKRFIYWMATGFLAFGMLAQGVAQLRHTKGYVDMINAHLGYPSYFLSLIGAWKLLGAIAIVVPRLALVKEWAYAGFFFVMSGAVFSHLALGDSVQQLLPSSFLLILTATSWYLRPASKKILSVSQVSKQHELEHELVF